VTAGRDETLALCPACGEPVIDATFTDGARILLQPRPSARGAIAAKWNPGGWHARDFPAGGVLAAPESRYHPHTPLCPGKGGGRKQWADAVARQRHAARAQRGRHRRPVLRRPGMIRRPPPAV
jgi:hypothetical protein